MRRLLAFLFIALFLSISACAFLPSDPATNTKPTTGQAQPVRYSAVLASLESTDKDQLQSAAKVGTQFLLSGLAEDAGIRILHYKWTALRVDKETQGLDNVRPVSTTFGLTAVPVIRFRYEAVNDAKGQYNYDGIAVVTYSPDWKTVINFEF